MATLNPAAIASLTSSLPFADRVISALTSRLLRRISNTVNVQFLTKFLPVSSFDMSSQTCSIFKCSTKWSAIALLGCIGGGLVSCSPRLQTETIATQIYEEFSQQDDVELEKVICPAQVQPDVGQTFHCAGRVDRDTVFSIVVEQIDEAENIRWEVPHSRSVINLAKLETYFTQALGRSLGTFPLIDCGGDYRLNREGERFDCALEDPIVVDDRQVETIQVKLDSLGNVNWHQVRNLIPPEEEVDEGFIEEGEV